MNGKFIRRKGFSSDENRIAAFTLVELLVVVAIIALLVSILLPSLGRAKELAKIVVCQTNLKGLGVGYTFYTNQHNEWYPASAGWGLDPPTWDWRMKDEYGTVDLLHCPSDRLDRGPWYGRTPTGLCPGIQEAPRSYAMNMCVSYRGSSVYGDEYSPPYNGEIPNTSHSLMFKTSDVDMPAETYVLGEQWESFFYGSAPQPGVHGDHKGSGIEDGIWSSSVPRPAPSRSATFYHSNNTKANYLFCDSHVETLPEDHPYLIDTNGNGVNDPGEMYYCKRRK